MTKMILFFFLFFGTVVAMEGEEFKDAPSSKESRRVTFAADVKSPRNEELRQQQKRAHRRNTAQEEAALKKSIEDGMPKDVDMNPKKNQSMFRRLRDIKDQKTTEGFDDITEERGSIGAGFSSLKIAARRDTDSKDQDESSQKGPSKDEISEEEEWSD